MTPERPTLAGSASPFLRHGAEQPVAWLPWGDAAFELARAEDRPLLLDIGAVWCHWCHVMDRESYEDAETAALINELFVPVKVDRDERPDVDARYQRAVQTLAGQGGWPLTAFLTPEGDVFYGGTYFPPVDAHGRPSFRRVLREIARLWGEDRTRALESAQQIRSALVSSEAALRQAGELSDALADLAVEAFADDFDFRHGGFGRAPKFPNAGALDLLLDRRLDGAPDWAERVVRETLDAMGGGGVYDQLGGGFHRYSVDARWIVPHFEKMAYDNGALLETYARAAAVFGSAEYRRVAEGILAHYRDVAPELLERGGFHASQDADHSMEDDGDYWTWTAAEIRAALGDDRLARIASLRYGLDDDGGAMHLDPERRVLFHARGAEAIAAATGEAVGDVERELPRIRDRLKEVRDGRPRPYVDETVYTDWTALVASGHLAAARFLGADDAAADALRALERLAAEAWRDGLGFSHRLGDDSAGRYLSDQAMAARACLDAFELTQDARWLERARAAADVLLDRFLAADGGGFLDRPADEAAAGALDQPHRPIADSPEPSGNAVAALVLLRLHALDGDDRWDRAARRVLTSFAGSARRIAAGAATYFRAVDWAVRPVTTVVVVGAGADVTADPLFRAALRHYRPRTVLRRFEAGAVDPSGLPAELRAMVTAEAPRAYLCAGRTCAAPVAAPDELIALLRGFRG